MEYLYKNLPTELLRGFFNDLALTLMVLITIAPSVDPGCKKKPDTLAKISLLYMKNAGTQWTMVLYFKK